MSSPTPSDAARIARLRRTAARLRRRLHPTSVSPAVMVPAQPSAPAATVASPSPAQPAAAEAGPAPAASSPTAADSSPAPADSSPAAANSAARDRWWTRLERSVALLVSISTLAAAAFTWVTIRQAGAEQRLTRDGQVTDRYNAAVTNLGADSEEVRIGGLYALQRIAQDSPRDAPTVVQVISAYVRSHTPPLKPDKAPSRPADDNERAITPPFHPANDIDTALQILAAPLDPNAPADLHDVNLRGVDLHAANLPHANLTGANLILADVSGANLTGADLTGTDLYLADVSGTNMSGSNLTGTDLRETGLAGANLSHANLRFADLHSADLPHADLQFADLSRAELTGAELTGADLTGADLSDTDLTGVEGYKPPPGT